MTRRTRFTGLVGIDQPLVQAPMAGTDSTTLAAAVANAGGLGSLGCAYSPAERIVAESAAIRALTDRPFNLNFFVAPQPGPVDPSLQYAAISAVAHWYEALGLPVPTAIEPPFAPDLDAQLDAALEVAPAVVTVHLGALPRERVDAFHARGVRVGGAATSVAEARVLEGLGFDFVIAQGAEAGGHRGCFLHGPHGPATGTMALTRMIVRAVSVPVVAAGGIMDGAGIAAALALGAGAAQLGTAFLPCPESRTSETQRRVLLAQDDDHTRLTEKFSGRPARGIENRFLREAAEADYPQLPFPAQNSLVAPLRAASAKAGREDCLALWSGQAGALARVLPAAELVATLVAELAQAVGDLGSAR